MIVSQSGVTLVSSSGNSLSFAALANHSGTPGLFDRVNMKIFVSGVQVALVTFVTPCIGMAFIFTSRASGVSTDYSGTLVSSGRVDFWAAAG
jgi:hypothetical protein